MKAFIFIKTTIPNEVNLRAQVIRNSGEPLFCVPYWDLRCYMYTTKKRAPCDNFLKNHELWTKRMVYLKWALANLQNMTIYYHSGKYSLSIRSSLEYWCKIVFVCRLFCDPQKDVLRMTQMSTNLFFSRKFENNFYQVFQLNNSATFTVFQRNIISPVNLSI